MTKSAIIKPKVLNSGPQFMLFRREGHHQLQIQVVSAVGISHRIFNVCFLP